MKVLIEPRAFEKLCSVSAKMKDVKYVFQLSNQTPNPSKLKKDGLGNAALKV